MKTLADARWLTGGANSRKQMGNEKQLNTSHKERRQFDRVTTPTLRRQIIMVASAMLQVVRDHSGKTGSTSAFLPSQPSRAAAARRNAAVLCRTPLAKKKKRFWPRAEVQKFGRSASSPSLAGRMDQIQVSQRYFFRASCIQRVPNTNSQIMG